MHVAYSTDEAVRAAYAKQAAHDWHEFVAFRGRELCPGGQLRGADDGPRRARRIRLPAAADRLGRHALPSWPPTAWLTEDEVRRMCLPTVGPARRADFLCSIRAVGLVSSGCPSSTSEVFDAEDRFWTRYQVDHDATAFGALWAAFVRASVFPTLAPALDGGRADPRSAAVRRAGWRPVVAASAGRRTGGDADPAGPAGADETAEGGLVALVRQGRIS